MVWQVVVGRGDIFKLDKLLNVYLDVFERTGSQGGGAGVSTLFNVHNTRLTPAGNKAVQHELNKLESSKPSSSKDIWVVLDPFDGTFVCLRCGEEYKPTYPIPFSVMIAAAKAFEKDHKRCKRHTDGDVCLFCKGRRHVPRSCLDCKTLTREEWWKCRDTGLSSKTMFAVLNGQPGRTPDGKLYAPSDPQDFGRCYRLLKRFPDWQARVGEMAEIEGWKRLAECWDELARLYEEEVSSGACPKLNARMAELRQEQH